MALSKQRQKLLTAAITLSAVFSVVVFLAAASPSFAAASTADGSAAVNDFIDAFVTKGQGLTANVVSAARTLFWILAAIQLAWAVYRLALNGNYTLTGIAGTVIREVLFIGFFYWLLTQGATLGSSIIVSGLRTLGGGGAISPGQLLSKGVEVVYALTKTAFELGVHNTVWAAVPYALALGALAFSAAYAAVYLLEYYIAVPLGIILLGFGGSIWSKKFAENYVRVLISIGFKLAALQIAIAIAITTLTGLQTSINNYATVGTQGFFLHAFNLAGLAALIFVTVSKLPALVAGLVAGTWFQSATGTDFTLPSPSSAAPVYAGITGDEHRSVYLQEAAAMQSSSYEGTGGSQYWQGQEFPGSFGEGYGQRADLSAASSGASYSGTAEAGSGRDAPTESSFLGGPGGGAGGPAADGLAASGPTAGGLTGSGVIQSSGAGSPAAGAGSSASEAPTESLLKSSGAPGSLEAAAKTSGPSGSEAPTESDLLKSSDASGSLEAVGGAAAAASASTSTRASGPSGSGAPTESGLLGSSGASGSLEAAGAAGGASTSAKTSGPSGSGAATESGLLESSGASGGDSGVEDVNASVDAPGQTGSPSGGSAANGPGTAGGNSGVRDANVSVDAPGQTGSPSGGSAANGPGTSGGNSGVRDANVSVDAPGAGGGGGVENLRSAVMDSLAFEGGGGGGSGQSDRMAEHIQKQFPMTEMSPLQVEIFKGMTE